MTETKIVLITGCSSGIGYHLVTSLREVGNYKIYATSRNVEKLKQIECEAVVVKKLDLSDEDDTTDVVDYILQNEKRIDILVHCAGIGHCAPVEATSVADVKRVINTNSIGMMSLTSKVLPSMKNRQIGHIVAVSAICGIIGFPFNSIYSASKFALEGYCESLREELKDFCINLTLVEPGPVFTHFDQKSVDKMADKDFDSTTKKLFETFMQKNNDSYQTMGQTPEEVAVQIRQLIEHGKSEQLRHYTNPIYTNALSQVYREEVSSSG